MNDQSKVIDETGAEVLDPRKVLAEQSIAVDLARIEIDQQIATAHKFPRMIDSVFKKISTLACYNKDSAESCIYSLPRGGKPIIGPSIGFANIVAQAWGNCRIGSRISYIDTKQKVVIAEGAFLDLETNTQSIVPVQRRIVDRSGRLYNEDMQIVTGMAAASIARRNAILQGVSRGLWHPVWMDALNIVRGDVTTFAENKAAAFKALTQFGVKPEQVFLVLGLKGDLDLTFEHIPILRGMYQALRDGSTTVEDMFDPRKMTGKGFATVVNPLGGDEDDGAAEDQTAGMGEAPAPTAAAAAAPAQKQEPAASAKPAAAETTAAPNVDDDERAELVPQKPKPTKAAEPKKPTTAAEYLEHWRAFCAAAGTIGAINNQHAAERALRKECSPFSDEQFAEINTIKDERIAALKK